MKMSDLPSEVIFDRSGSVDGLGNRDSSCIIPIAVPAAMAAPRATTSQKSG